MIKLKKLTDEKFDTASAFFASTDFKNMTKDYYSYVYTSCLKYLDTGDVAILNRVMLAAKYAQRIRVTRQLVAMVACHQLVDNKYKGKANKPRLVSLRKKADQLKERQEAVINRDLETKEKKATTFNADQVTTRAVNALATLLAHGEKVDLTELLKLAQAQKDSVKLKSTPVVEVGADATEVVF